MIEFLIILFELFGLVTRDLFLFTASLFISSFAAEIENLECVPVRLSGRLNLVFLQMMTSSLLVEKKTWLVVVVTSPLLVNRSVSFILIFLDIV